MNNIGIICEYNPLHLGHKKQIDTIRAMYPDAGIVCLMSGNYVQRGMPAILDKSLRANAAVLSGADLVLELPVTASVSSAENFAAQGVKILGNFCTHLCFGSETGSKDLLMATAQALLSEDFPDVLASELAKGVSFPAARQAALAAMGVDNQLLRCPNDILAVEYCKAVIAQKLPLEPLPITRQGHYHDLQPDTNNPSATALRALMLQNEAWLKYVPESARTLFADAPLHTLSAGETAILAKLRTMTEEEFQQLPYGSEGLWRKLMHACRKEAALEDIIAATKSKRYTRSRLDRMILCAFLGLTESDLHQCAPHVRILAFNDHGRTILRQAKDILTLVNPGQTVDNAYQQIETRCGRLYGLFACGEPEPPDVESSRRVVYIPTEKT